MGLKDVLQRMFKKDERFEYLKKEMKIRRLLEQRQKNSNERELERFMEEKRQEQIKSALEKFREEEKNKLWHSSMFNEKSKVLHTDKQILKEPTTMFQIKSDNLATKGMFFK